MEETGDIMEVGEKDLKVKKEAKVETPGWLEGDRQLVAVASVVLAPVSNPWIQLAPAPFFLETTLRQTLNSVCYSNLGLSPPPVI